MLERCFTSAKKHAFSLGCSLYVSAVAEMVEVSRARMSAHCEENSIVAAKGGRFGLVELVVRLWL